MQLEVGTGAAPGAGTVGVWVGTAAAACTAVVPAVGARTGVVLGVGAHTAVVVAGIEAVPGMGLVLAKLGSATAAELALGIGAALEPGIEAAQ